MIDTVHYDQVKAWPFLEARKILARIENQTPKKGYVLFETGYGPSGLPHIGTFGEVVRTTMVRNAFKTMSDIPTRLFCFSDDLDGLRKIPDNVPKREMLKEFIAMPLTSIPDPYDKSESFAGYMNAKLREFLDRFGFEYEFQSATEWYKSGRFDKMLLHVLEKYDEIMNIMLPTLGEERQETYSPFMPICPDTGRVLQVPIIERNLDAGTIVYVNDKGKKVEVPVTGGHCKLQWKPDFAMRWAALEVDYEMYGKDIMSNAGVYTDICVSLGGKPPIQFFYELFLNEEGKKISKSKGNGLTVDEWLTYAPSESLKLFMYISPHKAKKLYFDVIPKNVDDYLNLNQSFFKEEDMSKKLESPVYHIHNGDVPRHNIGDINFSLLLNLASVCQAENKDILWSFISKYDSTLSASNAPYLDQLVGYAVRYYNDFVKNTKKYLKPTDEDLEILNQIKSFLESLSISTEGNIIQKGIYDIGMSSAYKDNLRDFFKMLYEVLLGQPEGPRLGSFISLYGIKETIILIKNRMKANNID